MTHDANINIDINIIINNEIINIKLNENFKIGEGEYGNVYYLKIKSGEHCIIKLSKNIINNFSLENYIYYKYHKSQNNIDSLPKCYGSGKTINKYDNKEYNYIIVQYAGYITLKKFMELIILSKKIITQEIIRIIDIIYTTGLIFIRSLHDHNIICRDIKHENIIVSDYILSYYINYIDDTLIQHIPNYILNIIPQNVTYNNIIDFFILKNYSNLIKFIDAGLFCDLNILSDHDKYNKYDDKCNSDFCNFEPFDSLFATTMPFLSPFAIFNLSSIINFNPIEYKKHMVNIIKYSMKLSDIWSYNIIFIIFYHSFIDNYYHTLKMTDFNIKKYFSDKSILDDSLYMLLYDIDNIDNIKKINIKNNIINNINKLNFESKKNILKNLYDIINIAQNLICYIDNSCIPFEVKFVPQNLISYEENIKNTFNNIYNEHEKYILKTKNYIIYDFI
jgi:hypothetical protein